MARTIRTKVFKFNELNEDAKERAIEDFRYSNTPDFEYSFENIKEDAKEIGLKIISLSDDRQNEGEWLLSANEVAQNIFNSHGEMCETYKTAQKFMDEWEPVFAEYMQTEEGEEKLMELEDEFLQSLLEDYRILYNNDLENQSTDEYIKEQIEANEYEFTKDGNMFN
jgi:hypothetical protein